MGRRGERKTREPEDLPATNLVYLRELSAIRDERLTFKAPEPSTCEDRGFLLGPLACLAVCAVPVVAGIPFKQISPRFAALRFCARIARPRTFGARKRRRPLDREPDSYRSYVNLS